MMLRHRNHIFCACSGKGSGPEVRIETFCREEGDKIFVAEFRMLSVGADMVFVLRRVFDIHIPGIPFVGEGRNTVKSPVEKDTKLGFRKPARHFKVRQRVPGVMIGTTGDHFFDLCKVLRFVFDSKHSRLLVYEV